MEDSDSGHGYLSTACTHDLHERCRHICKFCPAPCLCMCHWNKDRAQVARLLRLERSTLKSARPATHKEGW